MSQDEARQSELEAMADRPGVLTPHSRPLPVQDMAPMSPPPEPVNHDAPHLSPGETVLQRRMALATEEAMREESNRRAWSELQKAEDTERHRRGIARMMRANQHYRDERDRADDERHRR